MTVLSAPLPAQQLYLVGALPEVNVNMGLPRNYSLNFNVESRQLFATGEFGGNSTREYNYALTDLSLLVARKVGLNNKLAGGYLARIVDGRIIHRTIQQFSLISLFRGIRLGHRFVADQTFARDLPTEVRLRYRITGEFPLSGESVDPGEFYIKVNHEYLNIFEDNSYNLELRLVPLMGYAFSDNNKLEYGLDYRLSRILDKFPAHRFWLSISWYVQI